MAKATRYFDLYGKMCKDNSNLVPYGVIPPISIRCLGPNYFSQYQIDHPPKGTTYEKMTEECNPSSSSSASSSSSMSSECCEKGNILETCRLLPASEIQFEVRFWKFFGYGNPDKPIDAGFTPIGAMIGTLFYVPDPMIRQGTNNDFIWHFCEGEMVINYPVTITADMLSTVTNGRLRIDMPGYPMSVFAAIKERTKVDEMTGLEYKTGIDFTDDQLANLGKPDGPPYLPGTTDNVTGQFGQCSKNVLYYPETFLAQQSPPSKNLFVGIVRDDRKYKFRGDNQNSLQGSGASRDTTKQYFPIYNTTRNDLTDKTIEIKVNEPGYELQEGNVVYITAAMCYKRHFRWVMRSVASGQLEANVTYSWPKRLDIWHFTTKTWRVPTTPTPSDFNSTTGWKIELVNWNNSESYQSVEGWRLSQSIVFAYEFDCWAADDRGILYIQVNGGDKTVTVMFPKYSIRDQVWYTEYMRSIKREYHPELINVVLDETQQNAVLDAYQFMDIEKFIKGSIDSEPTSGFVYDVSEANNSFLFDREKVFYHLPFALAIKKVSKYDSNDTANTTGIGIIHLDLKRQNVMTDGDPNLLNQFDLSNASFDTAPIETAAPNQFGHYAQYVFDYPPASEYYINSPKIYGFFGSRTRLYLERVSTWQGRGWILAISSLSTGTISADNHPYLEHSLITFEDRTVSNALAYHLMSHSGYFDNMGKLKYDVTATNTAAPFTLDGYKHIGASRLIGCSPSYTYGRPMTSERIYLCTFPGQYGNVVSHVDLLPRMGRDSSGTRYFDLASDEILKGVNFKYTIPSTVVLTDAQKEVALYFDKLKIAINNISMPTLAGENSLFIEGAYYGGGRVKLQGSVWDHMNITAVDGYVSKNSTLQPFKIQGQQIGVCYDSKANIYVFYADTTNDDISVAVSEDDGESWVRYSGFLRLLKGERASSPFAVSDKSSGMIELYYKLNDVYLMHKTLNVNAFHYADAFVPYQRKDKFDPFAENNDADLANYTDDGIAMRKAPSFFVAGNCKDQYFKGQMEITHRVAAANTNITSPVDLKYYRFGCDVDASDMDREFSPQQYSIYRDSRGVYRMFYIINSKLFIRIGTSPDNWRYLVKDFQDFHKNFLPEDSGKVLSIDNIQAVYDIWDHDNVLVLYFHNEMLFARILRNSCLDFAAGTETLTQHLSLSKTPGSATVAPTYPENPPVFLAGKIDDALKREKMRIENEVQYGSDRALVESNSHLVVEIPYSVEEINSFGPTFGVNSSVQPCGFRMKSGATRIFYRDSDGNLAGMSLPDMHRGYADVKYKPA